MYCDLYLPFPASSLAFTSSKPKRDKGKGKARDPVEPAPVEVPRSCWDGLAASERGEVASMMGMAGHLGCDVVALTVTPPTPGQVPPSPFKSGVPFSDMDPRSAGSSSGGSGSEGPRLVQLSRLQIPLDDSGAHGLTANNTPALNTYDLLSVLPLSLTAFSAACLSHTQPGPNQVAIITLPLHQAPRMAFPFKRSLVKQALRHGAVFELCYAPALAAPSGAGDDLPKRARQNFMTNAREVIRVTGGRGIVFSAGAGAGGRDGWYAMRGPADLINLGCLLGMKANMAKEAVIDTPRKVLLKSQARKYYKGVTGIPRMIQPAEMEDGNGQQETADKRKLEDGDTVAGDWTSKKIRLDA